MAGGPDGTQEAEEGPVKRFYSYMYGGTSTLLPTFVVFPIYKTVFRQQIHNTPVHQAMKELYREGPRKLYRGVAPPLLMRTVNGTLLFGLQDTLLHLLSSQKVTSTAALPALAGFGAGLVEAALLTPLERIQNVLQNSQNDRKLPTMKSVLDKLKELRLHSGYYRAFVPIAVRNAAGSALYFGLKGPMRDAVKDQGLSPMLSSFVSGTMTSMAVSLTLYPVSVLVANMQAQVDTDAKGVVASWRKIWQTRQQSVILLYRGGSLVIVRCITWGLITVIYDWQQKRWG